MPVAAHESSATRRWQARRADGPGQSCFQLLALHYAHSRGITDTWQTRTSGEKAGDPGGDVGHVRQDLFRVRTALVGQAGQPEAQIELWIR
jgi:hypothetical protein